MNNQENNTGNPNHLPEDVLALYQSLTAEMDLIDKKGTELAGLIDFHRGDVAKQLKEAYEHGTNTGEWTKHARLQQAQPDRWISIAEDHLQQGLMALRRVVAQQREF